MTRTNIELDDDLVAEVMRRHPVSTKKDAVHLALLRLVGSRSTVSSCSGWRARAGGPARARLGPGRGRRRAAVTPAVLVDTSVWVEYLRGTTSRATVELRGLLDTDAPRVVTCEPVAMELLAGATDEPMLRRLERLVNGLRSLPVDPSLDFRVAADLFRRCRRGGLTVRNLTDCLIAAVALRHDVELVHQDADYEALSRVAPLKTRSVR